jgi:putative ABC transport system permease protein
MRSILSGFGISWGVLILVVLLGTGQGFQEAVMSLFSVFAQKSIYVYGGVTSKSYNNIKEGKEIRFDDTYLNRLQKRYSEIVALSPEMSTSVLVRNNTKSGVFNTFGVNADYMQIKILQVYDKGRLFTFGDVSQSRPVAIIGEQVATTLFGKEDALEKHIAIGGALFRVIGVIKNENLFSASEIGSIYIPYTSYQQLITKENDFRSFCLYLSSNSNSKVFEEDLKSHLAHHYQFSSDDKQAVYIANFETQTSAFEGLFRGIRLFIWGVGICFLISGIVGVCNIMFVVVKERTNEIGIRLAVGALPHSIIQLVLLESIIITTVAGIIGLLLGNGMLMLIDELLSMAKTNLFVWRTSLHIGVAVAALIILIIAGIIAGAFPAIKASTIEPVDAIRYENRG